MWQGVVRLEFWNARRPWALNVPYLGVKFVEELSAIICSVTWNIGSSAAFFVHRGAESATALAAGLGAFTESWPQARSLPTQHHSNRHYVRHRSC
jgi:hypothetical protein